MCQVGCWVKELREPWDVLGLVIVMNTLDISFRRVSVPKVRYELSGIWGMGI